MWCWFFAGRTSGAISSRSARAGLSTKSGPWLGCDAFATCIATIAAVEIADPNLPTPCRKVLTSLEEHWAGLTRFLDDARIPLDNNASERQARGPTLGRKNSSGSGALGSGCLAALLFSLFATVTLAQINIRTWLTQFLESCAQNGGQVPLDIDPFLPWKISEERRRAMALDPDDSS